MNKRPVLVGLNHRTIEQRRDRTEQGHSCGQKQGQVCLKMATEVRDGQKLWRIEVGDDKKLSQLARKLW